MIALNEEIINCAACPRLVEWREKVASEKVRRFRDQQYWGKPVPGFGDPQARLLIIGLAPAAHGGNRTGRVFTGDRSGDWLYRALYRAGFANQPESTDRMDSLALRDCYISAVIRCAPPDNKPAPDEVQRCRGFLLVEKELLEKIRVVVALGAIAFKTALEVFESPSKKPKFGHGVEHPIGERITLIGSFHPSQKNTFTGRLTEPMLDQIFKRAASLIA